ncbi:hypothetical protein [Desulfosporosinus fructosivorans]
MSLINSFRNAGFELNGLTYFLIALVLLTVMVFVVRKIVLALKTERKIDAHLRETRARISKALTEIEDSKVEISEVIVEGERPSIPEISELASNGRKTRAMSMEDRWAEFDKKRSMWNTA